MSDDYNMDDDEDYGFVRVFGVHFSNFIFGFSILLRIIRSFTRTENNVILLSFDEERIRWNLKWPNDLLFQEYEDDSVSEPDVDLENQYYNAKGLKSEGNIKEAIAAFKKATHFF